MSYTNPHAKVTKMCPVCGKQFETIVYYNQVYDTAQCYRRAKNKRRMDRSNPEIPTKIEETRSQLIESDTFFRTIHNPKVEELDNSAKLILLDMNENKPIKLTGVIPEWKSPKGVALGEQIGAEPRTWIMTAREVGALDALLGL